MATALIAEPEDLGEDSEHNIPGAVVQYAAPHETGPERSGSESIHIAHRLGKNSGICGEKEVSKQI